MSSYRNTVVVDKSSVVSKSIYEAAAKSMSLNMLSQHKMGGVFGEDRGLAFFSKPVEIKITLLREAAEKTKIVIESGTESSSMLQSFRLKKQINNLANIIKEVVREDYSAGKDFPGVKDAVIA